MYLQESSLSLGENPYWVFVSFLYAVVAAEIAQRFAKVSYNWLEYKQGKPISWFVPVYSHLILAGFVVGTSWLAWTQAFVEHQVGAPGKIIELSSLLLIVDFWILAAYFGFVSVVSDARLSDGSREPGTSSSTQAAY